jgi:heme-degrading monooxygenase HmoA
MHAFLTLVRYKKRFVYFALSAMVLHRLPLWLNRNVLFYKTLGCGKGGTFSRTPDWQQYGLLVVRQKEEVEQWPAEMSDQQLLQRIYGKWIVRWWNWFGCETMLLKLEPIEGHGTWDGKQAFGPLPPKSGYEGPIGILTRATIRYSKRNRFWQHVEAVAEDMRGADGYWFSVGIGESPFLRQATFSVWESKEKMKQFAYKMHNHAEVVQKTRKENWYSEDMFVRFKLVETRGTIEGSNPLANRLASLT